MYPLIYPIPKWLYTKAGMVNITIQLPTGLTYEIINHRKVVKSGTYIDSTYKGLLWNDTDISDSDTPMASLLIKGSYIDSELPASVKTYASDLATQGLYNTEETSDFMPFALTKLDTPVISAEDSTILITRVDNATSYTIYSLSDEIYTYIGEIVQPLTGDIEYDIENTGTYVVVATGDYLKYKNSDYSNEVEIVETIIPSYPQSDLWQDIVIAPEGTEGGDYYSGILVTGLNNLQVLESAPASVTINAIINEQEISYTLCRMEIETGIYIYANGEGDFNIMIANDVLISIVDTTFDDKPATKIEYASNTNASVLVMAYNPTIISSFEFINIE